MGNAMVAMLPLMMMTAAEGTQPVVHGDSLPADQAVGELLADFAADYRNDPMAIDSDFGIKVGEDWWTVKVKRRQEAHSPDRKLTSHRFGTHEVELTNAAPAKPTWYFDISSEEVVASIASGKVNGVTASMRSFGGDRVGLSMEAMDGFEIDPGAVAEMYAVQSHFWTKGVPEVTYFGRDKSLPTHGAAATALYAMKDKRVMWFSLGPDESANEDPRLESGQVPNLFIITKGRGLALLGDQELELHEGVSVFIPPYTRHVLRNPYDEPLEGILVLFGDNSDFAHGTSYPDFIEDLHAFYGTYPFRK